jgi:integrase
MVSSAAGQTNSCNEGIKAWSRRSFGPDEESEPKLEVGRRLLQVTDLREMTALPADADVSNLPHPLIPTRLWPAVRYGAKRSITREEHAKIIARETNPERRAFYQLAWYTGASQTDLANLTADRIDWENKQIAFHRKKTNTPVQLFFGDETTKVLGTLPRTGPLFP